MTSIVWCAALLTAGALAPIPIEAAKGIATMPGERPTPATRSEARALAYRAAVDQAVADGGFPDGDLLEGDRIESPKEMEARIDGQLAQYLHFESEEEGLAPGSPEQWQVRLLNGQLDAAHLDRDVRALTGELARRAHPRLLVSITSLTHPQEAEQLRDLLLPRLARLGWRVNLYRPDAAEQPPAEVMLTISWLATDAATPAAFKGTLFSIDERFEAKLTWIQDSDVLGAVTHTGAVTGTKGHDDTVQHAMVRHLKEVHQLLQAGVEQYRQKLAGLTPKRLVVRATDYRFFKGVGPVLTTDVQSVISAEESGWNRGRGTYVVKTLGGTNGQLAKLLNGRTQPGLTWVVTGVTGEQIDLELRPKP